VYENGLGIMYLKCTMKPVTLSDSLQVDNQN
jgi:hypothetical protein